MSQSTIALTLGNIVVRQLNGLFSLNDLHKASGGETKHEPSQWLRNDQTKALVAEIESAGAKAFESKPKVGTYACRELVIAYAAWISAAFHLKVIRVFLDAVQPQRPHNPAIDYDRISPAQAQDLKELVHHIAEAKVQGFGETWARLHRKFRVNSYLELPATRFAEARDYLLGKLDGHLPEPKPTAFSQAMTAARENALHYFDAVRAGQVNAPLREIPAQVLEGIVADSLMGSRFLAGFDLRTGQMQVQLVPKDASVFSFHSGDYSHAINAIPTQRLPELQDALNKRIARHLGALTA